MQTPNLQALTPAEVQAIAEAIVGGGAPTTGGELYAAYCQSCHGPEGRGGSGTEGSVRGASVSQINGAISGESAMRYLGSILNSTQIQRISDYLNGRDGGGGEVVEVGKLRYDTYCLACHGPEGRGGWGTEGSVRGASSYRISRAISNESAMRSLSSVPSQDIQYISDYLNGRSTPLVPVPTDGLALYGAYCAGCHGAAPGAKAGRSSAQIAAAIGNVSAMQTSTLQSLTTTQLDAIAVAIGGTGGTDGLALYTANCAGCHGAAPGTKAGRTAAQIQSAINSVGAMNTTALRSLTSTQIQAIASAIAGTPPVPTTGEGLYNAYCLACHGAEGRGGSGTGGSVRGASRDKIIQAISSESEMRYLSSLLSYTQIRLISEYLSSGTAGGGD